jgi:hypothetical protein
VNEENKKNHTELEYLSLIVTESLIYNLFRGNSKNELNNSIYSNSLMNSSNSHIAFSEQPSHPLKSYESIDDQLSNKFFNFVLDFANDSDFQKKLKLMVDRGAIKAGEEGFNQNQRYADILLETMDYILRKEGTDKSFEFENFKHSLSNKNNKTISSHYEKKNLRILIGEVNKIIFSSKLNRIAFLLSDADEKLYFSLTRIYFGQTLDDDTRNAKNQKYYAKIDFTGQEMIFNLISTYV